MLGTRVLRADRLWWPLGHDRVRPLALGGAHTDGNVQMLCRGCHRLKTGTEFGTTGSCRTS
ncbi:HNH endonuclease [Streptomyces sp. NPDC026092]|uniref:HNH endonuclease n=1 Tax=Streptomyces sp. NPDC026092 TaxID=3154797 RepID=UPI00340A46AE